MLIGTVTSKNNIAIRLTEERWLHIIMSHKEIDASNFPLVLDTIENPDFILEGDLDELLAVKRISGKKTWFVVAYKEVNSNDGFILTAYITTDSRWLFKRKILWSKTL